MVVFIKWFRIGQRRDTQGIWKFSFKSLLKSLRAGLATQADMKDEYAPLSLQVDMSIMFLQQDQRVYFWNPIIVRCS